MGSSLMNSTEGQGMNSAIARTLTYIALVHFLH